MFGIMIGGVLYFSNVQPSKGIGLPTPPVPVLRIDKPSYDYRSKIKVAPAVSPKINKITFIKYRELPLYIYAMDKDFIVRPEISKIIKELRAGDLPAALVGNAILLLVLYGIWTLAGGADGFQIPVFHPRNGAIIRPANGGVQQQINHPKNSGKITVRMSNSQQVSTNVIPTQTQMSGFVKDGKVDLNQAFSEVNRRASAIGCETFDCSFDRFKELATECGEINDSGVREAITILQGEMHGYYKNARRVDYGPNVKGIDFAVDGLGEFENITHAEAKNAVGSAIETADGFDANIWKQGKKIGKKSVWQKNFWSNPSRISQVLNLNSDAYLPKSVNNTLTVVDCYDVPNFEKETMNSAISFGAKNDTNLIILNNRTNI